MESKEQEGIKKVAWMDIDTLPVRYADYVEMREVYNGVVKLRFGAYLGSTEEEFQIGDLGIFAIPEKVAQSLIEEIVVGLCKAKGEGEKDGNV